MSDKLDRFSKHAKRALTLAQEEALRLNHDTIGTEHLLLGMVRVENSLAVQVLRAMNVEPGQVIRTMERTVGRGETMPTKRPALSPLMKRAIELAVDEARRMGSHSIGTEHFLLGLLRHEEGLAVNALRTLGIEPNLLRTELARHILQREAQAKQEARGPLPQPVISSPVNPPPADRLPPPLMPLDPLRYDLAEMAKEGKLDPVIGREDELERLILILSRRTKNNPLLVGEPGVGKRALVNALAQRMVKGQVPPSLLNRRLLVLDVSNLVTSIVYGELVEKRLQKVLDKGAASTSILFIDNIHRMVGATGTNIDLVNVIKLGMSRGELQVIGATTPSHYSKYIDTEAARDWHLQPVEIKESSVEETIQILRGVKSRYEDHHQLLIEDDAVNVAAHLAAHYVTDRFLPDKAIDLIDEACSYARMHKVPGADEVSDIFLNLKQVQKMKQEALAAQRFDDALELRYREVELESKLEEMLGIGNEESNRYRVTLEDVAVIVSRWTGVPASRMIEEERTRLQKNS